MTRIEDMLQPGELVLWRTDSAWKSAKSNLFLQIPFVVALPIIIILIRDGFEVEKLMRALIALPALAMGVFLFASTNLGSGVIVTDRRVLRAKGFFRPHRLELDRRHIASAVVYEGDETLILHAARPDAIRLVEPDSAASLAPAGESEMRFAAASVDNDAFLEALGIEPERIEEVVKPGNVANLLHARLALAFVVPPLLALGDWLVTALVFSGLSGLIVWTSVLVILVAGFPFGLWLAWPLARLTVPLETARMFACFLYHPDWKAVSPENDNWRKDLRLAENRLSWLNGKPVSLDDVPRPETILIALENEEPA